MHWLTAAAAAWSITPDALLVIHTYRVNATFCDIVLPRFREDLLLAWKPYTCDDVRAEIRNAFDEWQHNSHISFREVDAGEADTTIGAAFVPVDDMLARVVQSQTVARIEVDEDVCWYTDRSFCAHVHSNEYLFWSMGLVVWTFAGALGVYILCVPATRLSVTARMVNWAVFLSAPLLLFGAVVPCTSCYDFRHTLLHEVGHTLGFGHTDEPPQQCGCGASAAPCTLTDAAARDAIMHSRIRRTPTTCLSRDDVNGLRSIYGGACDAPIWCYESASYTGYSRVAVALLYGFVLAWGFVVFRDAVERCATRYRRRRRTTAPVKAIVAAPPRRVRRPGGVSRGARV